MIVAIDPGGTTGVAVKTGDGKYHTFNLFSQEEVWLWLIQNKDIITDCIFEQYTASGPQSRHGVQTMEIVGGIKALSLYAYKLHRHMPQHRKAFIDEARKLVSVGHTDHEVDALAHLLAWEYTGK